MTRIESGGFQICSSVFFDNGVLDICALIDGHHAASINHMTRNELKNYLLYSPLDDARVTAYDFINLMFPCETWIEIPLP